MRHGFGGAGWWRMADYRRTNNERWWGKVAKWRSQGRAVLMVTGWTAIIESVKMAILIWFILVLPWLRIRVCILLLSGRGSLLLLLLLLRWLRLWLWLGRLALNGGMVRCLRSKRSRSWGVVWRRGYSLSILTWWSAAIRRWRRCFGRRGFRLRLWTGFGWILSFISFSRASAFNEEEEDSLLKLEEDFLSLAPSFLPLLWLFDRLNCKKKKMNLLS